LKKTLIAAALLAGFAGVAHAQSSVTLYGIVDTGYVNTKVDGKSAVNGINSGIGAGSRFGVRGSEDLGSGLKANFMLEAGFNSDDGTQSTAGQLFNRQSWVGLSSDQLGEFRLGLQDSLGRSWFRGQINPFGNDYLQGKASTIFDRFGPSDRIANSVMYYTPTFSGFQGAAGYSTRVGTGAETAGNDGDNSLYDLGVQYKYGNLLAVVTYEFQQGQDAIPAQRDQKNLEAGLTYDFGFAKLAAGYGNLKNANYGFTQPLGTTASALNGNARTENNYLIGVTVPFGASKVFATYQRNDHSNQNAGLNDKAINGYAVGYNYSLSKRTLVYALLTEYQNVAVRADNTYGDQREIAVGVQHKF
jgi:predicted porin